MNFFLYFFINLFPKFVNVLIQRLKRKEEMAVLFGRFSMNKFFVGICSSSISVDPSFDSKTKCLLFFERVKINVGQKNNQNCFFS